MSPRAGSPGRELDSDCALWVLDALDSLQNHAGLPHLRPLIARDKDQNVQRMIVGLTRGRVSDCVELLENHRSFDSSDQNALAHLLVPAIHRLESDWKRRSLEMGTLVLAFGTARHVIDVWHASAARPRPNPAMPKEPVLVAVAPGDHHSFGAQILADDLTMRGYAVTLEAKGCAETLLGRVSRTGFAAMTLSVGHDSAFDGLAELVAQLRIQAHNPQMFVLVGGPALTNPTTQYAFLDADAVLLTAQEGADFLENRLGANAAKRRN